MYKEWDGLQEGTSNSVTSTVFLGIDPPNSAFKIFPDFACCSSARPLSDIILQAVVLLALQVLAGSRITVAAGSVLLKSMHHSYK